MRKALPLVIILAAFACIGLMPLQAQTMSHEADLTFQNPQCTTAAPCILQVYRAQCASATTCPSFSASPGSYNALPVGNVQGTSQVTVSVTSSGTTWSYIDTDPALRDSTTYVWVATDAYQSSPSAASGPSNPFQGTTLGPPTPPSASGKIVR